MMPVELRVPHLGESITEAVVGRWTKKLGESVTLDEVVVVLETDKVTVDVPAPAAGVLNAITAPAGSRVKVGEVIGAIAEASAAAAAPAQVSPAPSTQAGTTAPPGPAAQKASPTPVARAVALASGLDPATISGTGPAGRVTRADVLRAAHEQATAPGGSVVTAPPEGADGPAPPDGERAVQRVPMTPLRRKVAERLLAAQSTAAILTTFNEVDMTEVLELRKEHGPRFESKYGVKLGFMGFFVKAALDALRAFPVVNASIEGDEVVFHHYADVGIAVSGKRGLVVPVVRNAERLSLGELEQAVADLGARAREDKITLAELQGGTFTISNGGVFGSLLSTPILNPPQSGILGMHAIVERPVARGGQVVVRPMMYLALSYDHRLIDGREAVQFLVRLRDCVENPSRIVLGV